MEAIKTIPTKIHSLFEEHGTLLKIAKGNHIFLEGERTHDVFFVVSGKVRISKETESGNELTIRICGSNNLIGESTIFCSIGYSSTTATAMEPTTILAIDNNMLELYLSQEPSLMIECMRWLQFQNMKNQSRLRDLLLHGKKGALYSTLIRLANTYGETLDDGSISINYALTNNELANLCATSREVINRMLNDLKKNNIITFDKSIITVLNLQFLKDECECENCPLQICRID
ncbi:Crp/Fnr family transcriptional regulator [Viridibacillus soli]|uniref:Crp/Fnr family transcriptional regulator n=1 Tax=Viridibacillus soli TaxID=2798301 RepID=UPI001F17BD65|nr:Crp/Fnr family transcriptional regulator [Viridibacillus soli]